VFTGFRRLSPLLFLLALTPLGCRAQATSSAGEKLSPELARRVEILIRSKANLPPNYDVIIGPRASSAVPGYDEIPVSFSSEGKTTKPMTFLLSKDNNTLAQFNKFDISKDPKTLVSDAGRPARGGPANAPVVIIGFDDLQCPFCARMHEQLFPAILDRYKDKIRIVYQDFPLDQHPWAMRAAIDVNCLGTQSATAYWNSVDYIHAHASEIAGEQKSVEKANEALDTLTRQEGKRQKVDLTALDACIAKQDATHVKASMDLGTSLGIDATPALFINGEKLEGAVPLEYVFRMIDNALVASGQTPPPPYVPPAPASPQQTTPAAKTGN
jgi:protein-disulfide isomerase